MHLTECKACKGLVLESQCSCRPCFLDVASGDPLQPTVTIFLSLRLSRLKQEAKTPKASPMQREARERAAQDLSEQRSGGWFGRLHQVFRSNMGGTAEQQANAEKAARGQVGYRKRAMRPRQEETMPVHRALVPASYYSSLPLPSEGATRRR